jgi:hypothetical protein
MNDVGSDLRFAISISSQLLPLELPKNRKSQASQIPIFAVLLLR